MSPAVATDSPGWRRLFVWPRRFFYLPLALGVLVLANAAWVITQRRGQPLDIDEAGYVAISLNDYIGAHTAGISGWWHQIVGQGTQAPLAPALASLVDWVSGPRVLNAFAVSVLAYGLVLAATLGLTKGWSRLGRGTAVLFVAAAPVLVNYSRGFNFAELAAACLAGALYFGHRSRGFTKTAPALAWGVCLGLMLLARTMTVAFLPGLLLAALVPVLARSSRSGIMRIILALVLGAGVAATWYARNLQSVYSYLTSAGYGAQSAEYGPARSVFSPHSWYLFLVDTTEAYLFVGEAAFVLLGWLACAWSVMRRLVGLRTSGSGVRALFRQIRIWAADDPVVLSCAIVAAAGVTALMSSRNQGSAFIAPLVVPLVVVASWGTTTLARPLLAQRRVSAAAAVAPVLGVALAGLTLAAAGLTFLPASEEVVASVPFPEGARLTLWDSRGTLRSYEDGGGVPAPVEPGVGSQSNGSAWLAASKFVEDEIWSESATHGRAPVAVFTFNNRMINVNTVNLLSLLWRGTAIAEALLNPLPAGAPAAAYFDQVRPIDPAVTVVATVTSMTDEFQPAVPLRVGIEYARSLRFTQFARRRLPDGQWLLLWAPPS